MRARVLAAVAIVAGFAVPTVGAARPARAAGTPSLLWTADDTGWNRSSSPTLADVNGDGVPEIIVGHQNGWVRVLDAATGRNIPHWPQPAVVAGWLPTAIDGSPAVGDLDRNGTKQIVVPTGSTWVPNQPGGIVVFDADGTVRCRFRTLDFGNIWANTGGPDGYSDAVYSSPAIGDVDGDGHPDIAFGSFDGRVHVIDRFCHELPGFPYNVEDSVWSSPALYDVDKDGRLDVLIGSDQAAGGMIDWSGGEFRAIAWTPFGAHELWKRQVNDVITSSPAVGDIDGDGRADVVVGAGDFYHRSDRTKVFAWHVDDGSPLPGWPVSTLGATSAAPALGDVTGDGVADVAVASRDGILRIFKGNGQLYWQRLLRFNTDPGGPINAHPIVADINGDGKNDVSVGNNWGFFVIDGSTGREIAALNTWESYEAAAAVGNFGGQWKLVTSAFNTPLHTTRMQAFSIPAPGVTPPWPMFHHDPAHLGTPARTPSAPTAVTAVAQDGGALVSWHAASPNGSAILTYRVVTSPGGPAVTVTADQQAVRVSDLAAGNSYTFTVTADNAVGAGAPSAASAAVTITQATPFTYTANFTDAEYTALARAATVFGVPVDQVPEDGVSALAYIIAISRSAPRAMSPAPANGGSHAVISTWTSASDATVRAVANHFGINGDQAHWVGGAFMIYASLLRGGH